MWYFVAPEIVFGEDALDALDDLAGQRAFIVTDAHLLELGLVTLVRQHLDKAGLEVRIFAEVEPEPGLETVQRAAQQVRAFAPDWIIGLGGGSAMDAAKAIWVLSERPELQAGEIHPLQQLGLRDRWGAGARARLITIPTTSGTGAEATWAIVLTDTAAQRKLGLGNREARADLAIVDPALVADLPPQLTADTGLDALTHAVEGYTCTWHTDLTDGLCLNALRLVLAFLPRAVANGHDAEARERLHNAATCAGLGFGNAMASMAHAMGHALGSVFHLPHGRAVALYLPYTIEFAARSAPERFAELATFCRLTPCGQDAARGGAALAARIRALAHEVGNPTCIAQAGIARPAYEAALDKLMDDAFNDTQMVTAVRSPSYDELRQLYLYAYDGRVVDF